MSLSAARTAHLRPNLEALRCLDAMMLPAPLENW